MLQPSCLSHVLLCLGIFKLFLQQSNALLNPDPVFVRPLHVWILVHQVYANAFEQLVLLVAVLPVVAHEVVQVVQLGVEVADLVRSGHLLLEVLVKELVNLLLELSAPAVTLKYAVLLRKVEQLGELLDRVFDICVQVLGLVFAARLPVINSVCQVVPALLGYFSILPVDRRLEGWVHFIRLVILVLYWRYLLGGNDPFVTALPPQQGRSVPLLEGLPVLDHGG